MTPQENTTPPKPDPSPIPQEPQPPIPATPESPVNPVPTPPAPPEPVLTPPAPGTVPPSPEPAAASGPGQVVVGGFEPTPSAPGAPVIATQAPIQADGTPLAPIPTGKKRLSKPVMAGLVVALLAIIGGVYYFVFYNSPTAIYSSSLSNTGKGYDKLIDYASAQSKQNYKGFTAEGKYSFKQDATSIDGTIAAKSYDGNSVLNLDVGVAGTRVNGEVRSINSNGATPDVYVKVSGLQGIGSMFGSPEIDATLSKVNDQWIFIDHTLFDSLLAASGGSQKDTPSPSNQALIDAAKSFGEVNKEYLFATGDNAVLKVVKNKGKESFPGHTTYRYEVGFVKANIKKYIDAQEKALQENDLGKWLKDNGYEAEVKQLFNDMRSSSNEIKETDTFDMWMDTKQRMLYKVRVDESNKGKNFVDMGLDYRGGDTFPFFMSGAEEGTDMKFVAAINSKTNQVDLSMTMVGANNQGNFDLETNIKPTNTPVKIEKPATAKPLPQLWQELGLGDLNSQLQYIAPQQSEDPAADGVQAQAPMLLNLLNRS